MGSRGGEGIIFEWHGFKSVSMFSHGSVFFF